MSGIYKLSNPSSYLVIDVKYRTINRYLSCVSSLVGLQSYPTLHEGQSILSSVCFLASPFHSSAILVLLHEITEHSGNSHQSDVTYVPGLSVRPSIL